MWGVKKQKNSINGFPVTSNSKDKVAKTETSEAQLWMGEDQEFMTGHVEFEGYETSKSK